MKKLYQYPFSCIIQLLLCKIGIACHNPFRDECTPDFECCSPLHKERYWLRISASKLPIKVKVSYKPTATVGTEGRTFIKNKNFMLFQQTNIFLQQKIIKVINMKKNTL